MYVHWKKLQTTKLLSSFFQNGKQGGGRGRVRRGHSSTETQPPFQGETPGHFHGEA